MKLVVIESPFAGDVQANVDYAKRCVKDCLARGESPYASHLFFTQRGILDDENPEDRALGIEAGLAWASAAQAVVVYIDRGISNGMRYGIARHLKSGRALYIRSLERELSAQEIGRILAEMQQPEPKEIATEPASTPVEPEPAPTPVLDAAPLEEDLVIHDDANIPF